MLELRCEERHGQMSRVVWRSLVVQDKVDCSRRRQGQKMALSMQITVVPQPEKVQPARPYNASDIEQLILAL